MGGAALLLCCFPELSSAWVVAGLRADCDFVEHGSLPGLEQVLIPLVFIFTLTTLVCLA